VILYTVTVLSNGKEAQVKFEHDGGYVANKVFLVDIHCVGTHAKQQQRKKKIYH